MGPPDACHQLQDDLREMARTGLNPLFGGPISAVLAQRLPQLIAAAGPEVRGDRAADPRGAR